MKRILLASLIVSGLSACTTTVPQQQRAQAAASATPYRPLSPNDLTLGGYSTTGGIDNIFTVAFLGNPATPAETIKDSALYRAAEVTINSGNRYFTILDSFSESYSISRGVAYRIYCHNEFLPEAIDAAQLMNVIGNSYRS